MSTSLSGLLSHTVYNFFDLAIVIVNGQSSRSSSCNCTGNFQCFRYIFLSTIYISRRQLTVLFLHLKSVQPIAKLCITHRFNTLTVMGFSIILMSRSIRFRRAFSFLSSRGASTVFVLETANAPFLTENAVMGKCCIVHFEILLSHLIRINCYIDSPFELADLSVDCFYDGCA